MILDAKQLKKIKNNSKKIGSRSTYLNASSILKRKESEVKVKASLKREANLLKKNRTKAMIKKLL